ncbi:MAG: hypothetical protein M1829_001479 [Trizodia sp. TS-e1964]|nr:MAG: hypothetical protein M1829_001479 [Trizodia sp. TS-e1964]
MFRFPSKKEPKDRSAKRSARQKLKALEWGVPELRLEIRALGSSSFFGPYSAQHISALKARPPQAILDILQKSSPNMFAILDGCSMRSDKPREPLVGQLTILMSILCYAQHKYTATTVPTYMGLFLYANGSKKHKIQFFHKLGVCIGYTKVMEAVDDLSKDALADILACGRSALAVTAYDNFELSMGVKGQRVNENGTFHSVTTGEVIEGADIPVEGLDRAFLDRSYQLGPRDVMFSPGNTDQSTEKEISRYLVAEAIHAAFPSAVKAIFAGFPEEFPSMPVLDKLEPRVSNYQPLGPIPHNESTNQGNIKILNNIFQGQYSMQDDQPFKDRLTLLIGDQKTIQRLRSIAKIRRDAGEPFERFDWLFHLQMNTLMMVHRAHFGGTDTNDNASTLYYAANFWKRKRLMNEKTAAFHDLQELALHSFQARAAAIFVQEANKASPVSTEQPDMDVWEKEVLSKLRIREFMALVSKTVSFYIPPTGLDRSADRSTVHSEPDMELNNHKLFMQHAQTYLVLKHGIKHGDIGLLRRALDRLTVYFHGSKQHKYVYETLLVNLQGKPDTWFETDRLVEFHNGNMKHIFKSRHHWQLSLEDLFNRFALSAKPLSILVNGMRSLLEVPVDGHHPPKKPSKDLQVMASCLLESSVVEHPGRVVKDRAPELRVLGYIKLAGGAIKKVNDAECYDSFESGLADVVLDDSTGADGSCAADRVLDDFFGAEEED